MVGILGREGVGVVGLGEVGIVGRRVGIVGGSGRRCVISGDVRGDHSLLPNLEK